MRLPRISAPRPTHMPANAVDTRLPMTDGARRRHIGRLLALAGSVATNTGRIGMQQVSRRVFQSGASTSARVAAALAAVATSTASAQQTEPILSKLRTRGTLRVAIYRDFPPFYDEGRGISVELADRLAQALGLKAEPMPFPADESVDDDLRNMVWKGHYLGYGPADVMLQVPVDAKVIADNPQVRVFAPYYREGLAIAWDRQALPTLESLAPLAGLRVGVETASLAAFVMLSVEGGRLRDTLAVFRSPREAVAELRAQRLSAVVGLRSELESMLRDASGVAIGPVPTTAGQRTWALGLAVRKGEETLARELQVAIDAMAGAPMRELFARYGVQHLPA
jgi:cystine transport system substrate-binding protein